MPEVLLQIPKVRLRALPLRSHSPLLGMPPPASTSHCTCLPGDPISSFQLKPSFTWPSVSENTSQPFRELMAPFCIPTATAACVLYVFSLVFHAFPRPLSGVWPLTFSSLIDTSQLSFRLLRFTEHRAKLILTFSEAALPSVLYSLVNETPVEESRTRFPLSPNLQPPPLRGTGRNQRRSPPLKIVRCNWVALRKCRRLPTPQPMHRHVPWASGVQNNLEFLQNSSFSLSPLGFHLYCSILEKPPLSPPPTQALSITNVVSVPLSPAYLRGFSGFLQTWAGCPCVAPSQAFGLTVPSAPDAVV